MHLHKFAYFQFSIWIKSYNTIINSDARNYTKSNFYFHIGTKTQKSKMNK